MKQWFRISVVALAIMMIAGLALGVPATTRANHAGGHTCENSAEWCLNDCEGNLECVWYCGVINPVEDMGCPEAACPFVAYADAFNQAGCGTECADYMAEFVTPFCGSSASCAGKTYTPEECAANVGEYFCCTVCETTEGCDPDIACTNEEQCYDYCVAGGFNTPSTCDTCAVDGRITLNCSAPAAVYCDDSSFDVYSVDPDGNGTLAFSFDSADYADMSVEEPLLVGSANGVSVYLLPSGQFQIHAYQSDGKLYTFIWDSCTPGGNAEFSEYEG